MKTTLLIFIVLASAAVANSQRCERQLLLFTDETVPPKAESTQVKVRVERGDTSYHSQDTRSGASFFASIDLEGYVHVSIEGKSEHIVPETELNNAVAHFGPRVRGLYDRWQTRSFEPHQQESDPNLDAFKNAIRAGKSPAVAASLTPIGQLAEKAGFTRVEFPNLRPRRNRGNGWSFDGAPEVIFLRD